MYKTDDGITFEGPKKAIQIKRGKYIALQICDDEDVETMIESFEQQQEMSVIELCVEVDVAGASAINFTNSLLSCGNNMSHNESGSARAGTNSEEDFDDDDYLISNSYVEDSLDEDEDIDEISDTDDEATRLIEPLTIVEVRLHSRILLLTISHPDQVEICDLDMGSNFNMGQELYVGMEFDTKSAVKNALQQYVMKVHQSFKVVKSKSQKYVVCCGNRSDDIPCPFYMRAILSKKNYTWKVTQWGGPHNCLNMSITQDHDKLDSDLIATCVLGMIKEDPSLKNEALGWQPPHAYHVYCVRHIASNFNHKFKNGKQKEMLKKIRNFDKFCELSPPVKAWIGKISKEKWTMTYDKEGRRYGHMTTNLSECVNKVFKGCRNVPITALVKSTYSRCRKYFVDRGRQAQREIRDGQIYCSHVMKKLWENQEKACSHIVWIYDIQRTIFKVEEAFDPMTQRGGHKCVVNLNGRYCQCGQFTTYHYPCSHIIAACGTVNINFYQYIDVVYTNDYILRAYSAQWWPLGNDDAILPSDEPPDPSFIRDKKGRPRSTRLRNEMDWREPSQTRYKCGRCGTVGHNRHNCPLQSQQGSTFHGPPSGAFGVDSSPLWVNKGVSPEEGEDPNMPAILYPGCKSCGYEYIGGICDGSWVNASGV
ncbi:hypothetical protein GmHk_07G019485 [Glycine max]|nr:hypothetical protein GmHk_07G019485 [Glycine max]